MRPWNWWFPACIYISKQWLTSSAMCTVWSFSHLSIVLTVLHQSGMALAPYSQNILPHYNHQVHWYIKHSNWVSFRFIMTNTVVTGAVHNSNNNINNVTNGYIHNMTPIENEWWIFTMNGSNINCAKIDEDMKFETWLYVTDTIWQEQTLNNITTSN